MASGQKQCKSRRWRPSGVAGLVGRVAARPEADGELTAVACSSLIPPVVVAGRAGSGGGKFQCGSWRARNCV